MLPRILSILTFLMVLTGCCRDQDLKLSPALLAWAPYTGQQELTFTGPAGQKLVFVAELSRFNQEGSDKVCGSYNIETLRVILTAKDDPAFKAQVTLSHEIVVGIKVYREQPPGMGLDILYNTISEQYISDPWQDRLFKEISLNGETYRDVLYFHGSPVAGPLSFSEVYYGKEAGLIGFRLFSGDWYFRE